MKKMKKIIICYIIPINQNMPQWKSITNYPNYEVSNEGEFRNIKTNRILKQFKNKNNGYSTITLSKEGQSKSFNAHRLVGLHFIPNPENLTDLDHINGRKNDNSVKNLRWLSHQDNIEAYHTEKRRKQAILDLMNAEKRRKQAILELINAVIQLL